MHWSWSFQTRRCCRPRNGGGLCERAAQHRRAQRLEGARPPTDRRRGGAGCRGIGCGDCGAHRGRGPAWTGTALPSPGHHWSRQGRCHAQCEQKRCAPPRACFAHSSARTAGRVRPAAPPDLWRGKHVRAAHAGCARRPRSRAARPPAPRCRPSPPRTAPPPRDLTHRSLGTRSSSGGNVHAARRTRANGPGLVRQARACKYVAHVALLCGHGRPALSRFPRTPPPVAVLRLLFHRMAPFVAEVTTAADTAVAPAPRGSSRAPRRVGDEKACSLCVLQ